MMHLEGTTQTLLSSGQMHLNPRSVGEEINFIVNHELRCAEGRCLCVTVDLVAVPCRVPNIFIKFLSCRPVGEAAKAVLHYALSTLLRNTQR